MPDPTTPLRTIGGATSSFDKLRTNGRWGTLVGLLLLAACAGHPRIATGGPGTMRPYQVGGRWYYPSDDSRYDQKGIASWYGPGFHGKSTATGERFDQDGVTAAHKTLPLPSFVEVTNLDNGRTQLVRLNDRGPFVGDRIIDLSRRSAQLLGVDRTGTAKVRVRRVYPSERQIAAITSRDQARALIAATPKTVVTVETIRITPIVPPTAPPPPATVSTVTTVTTIPLSSLDSILPPTSPATRYVQIAAVSDEARAAALVEALTPLGDAVIDRSVPGLLRVRLGPFSATAAAEALARAQAAGYGDARVVGPAN